MTSKKPTGWGGSADAEFAPLMRLVDFVLIYAGLWFPTYARGEVWDQRSWAAATIAAVLFMAIAQSLRLYESARGASLKAQLVRAWAGWFVGVSRRIVECGGQQQQPCQRDDGRYDPDLRPLEFSVLLIGVHHNPGNLSS